MLYLLFLKLRKGTNNNSPLLFQKDGQKGTYGSWDIMSLNWSTQAIELNAWNRYISGWLKDSQIDCLTMDSLGSTSITRSLVPLVKSLSGSKAQLIRLSSLRRQKFETF